MTSLFVDAGLDPLETTITVSALNQPSGSFALVTAKAAHLVTFANGRPTLLSQTAGDKVAFTAAAATPSGLLLVGTSTAELRTLAIDANGSFHIEQSVDAEHAISTIHATAGFCAVGCWESNSVHVFSLSDLQLVTPKRLADFKFHTLPTSVLLHRFDTSSQDSPLHLFVGLGNGNVVIFTLGLPRADSASQSILVLGCKEASIGSKAVALSSIDLNAASAAVFAGCDRPTVISIGSERNAPLAYSSVQTSHVRAISQLSTIKDSGANCFALLGTDCLQIGNLGTVQKIDIQRVNLGDDDPVAIARVPTKGCFAVVCWRFLPYGRFSQTDRVRGSVKIFDQDSFELLDTALLEDAERPNCVQVARHDGVDYVVVGTGLIDDRASETISGRIIPFQIDQSRRLTLISEAKTVNGNVYALTTVGSRLAAAVNSDVVTFPWSNDPHKRLAEDDDVWGCAFIACTLSNPASNKLVVGDAMRSMSVLRVSEESGRISELARDCDPYWSTAVEQLDDATQTYIGSDVSFNVYVSQRSELSQKGNKQKRQLENLQQTRGDPIQDHEKRTPEDVEEDEKFSHVMRRGGIWHYGDLINKFRKGAILPFSHPSSCADMSPTQKL